MGTLDPDNPLAYAVYKALLNSNGQPVDFTGVADPTVYQNWCNALAMLVGLGIFTVVPLTTDSATLAAVKAHVDAQETGTANGWRRALLSLVVTPVINIVSSADSTDNNTVLATLASTPSGPSGQFDYFTVTSGNINLVNDGVEPGGSQVMVSLLITVSTMNEVQVSFPKPSVPYK